MFDSRTYTNEKENSLAFPDMLRIMDHIEQFESKYEFDVLDFVLTGGDPLLSTHLYPLLKELNRRGKNAVLAANPENLDLKAVDRLLYHKITFVQFSIDGLESTHDTVRGPGSFRKTIDAVTLLNSAGIRSGIMFTLWPSNASELIPLVEFLAFHTPACSFSFDFACAVGNGASITNHLSARQTRDLLVEYLALKASLANSGYSIFLDEKANLLKAVRYDQQSFYPLATPQFPVASGCLAGWTSVAILSDGSVLPCRRLPIVAGKMPVDSFESVMLGADIMKRLRRRSSFSVCGACDLYSVCRGCPALSYSLTGDPFSGLPMCFHTHGEHSSALESTLYSDPPLTADLLQEAEHLSSRLSQNVDNAVASSLTDSCFSHALLLVTHDKHALHCFMSNPIAFLKSNKVVLSASALALLVHVFVDSGLPRSKITQWRQQATDTLLSSIVRQDTSQIKEHHNVS